MKYAEGTSVPVSKTRGEIEALVERWGRDAIYMVLAGEHYRAAVDGLPYVEDVIGAWARRRQDEGLRPAHVSIGVLKKYLLEKKGFGA